MSEKDWITRQIDSINLGSKVYYPKKHLKGNKNEEDRFLNDLKYQY